MPTKITILDELTRPLPRLVNCARPGSNTTNPNWPDVGGWVEWEDFSANNLHTLFRSIVDAEWNIPSSLHTKLTDWDAEFFDEDELEHSILSRCILPPVKCGPLPRPPMRQARRGLGH